MGQIFISHSSKDNVVSTKVRDWLNGNGWQDVFLDLDPKHGLAPGQRWQDELRRAGERCSAVIVLISPDWVASKWCLTEFLLAVQLGKLIFPVFVRKTPFEDLPVELIAHFQLADISSPEIESDGYGRLLTGLQRAGLSPDFFTWPPSHDPGRRPFNGLETLEEVDAAVFFGRDGQITRGMDAVRSLRAGAPEKALIITGSSGVGKSSFLRAGLLARLARDDLNFVTVPVVRPARATMKGESGLIAAFRAACSAEGGSPADVSLLVEHMQAKRWTDAIALLRAPSLLRIRRAAEAAGEQSHDMAPPTVILAIDQAEEVFESNPDSDALAEAVRACLAHDHQCIAVFTVRSNSYSRLCDHPVLSDVRHLPFNLPPMSSAEFKDVITGPARLARPPVEFTPELVDGLVSDLNSSDALPLLAFTLQQLYDRFRNIGRPVTLANYRDDLGGLKAIISAAGLRAQTLAAQSSGVVSRSDLDHLLSVAFIPHLVTVDSLTREPQRRIARLDDIPKPAHPLLNELVNARLLTLEQRELETGSVAVVQVAHESIFRQWPDLDRIILAHSESLIRLSSLRRSASEWQKNGQQADWLEHKGERLADALATRQDVAFNQAFSPEMLAYVSACEASELARKSREREQVDRERRQMRRTRRFQLLASVLLLVFTAFLGAAVLGVKRITEAQTSRASDMLATLANDWAREGYHDRAVRFALAASQPPLPFLSFDSRRAEAVLKRTLQGFNLAKVLRGHENLVNSARFSPAGDLIATSSADGSVRLWNVATGQPVRTVFHQLPWMLSVAFSHDGKLLAATSDDHSTRLWNVATGAMQPGLFLSHSTAASVAFSPDDKSIAVASYDGLITVWNLTTPNEKPLVLSGHSDAAMSVAYSPDGSLIASASGDQHIILWDSRTGAPLRTLTGHTGGVWALAFSPDGGRLATGSADRRAIVWNVATGEQELVLGPHENEVTGIDFSADGQLIATASQGGVARIFNSHSAHEVQRFIGHVGAINTVAFSPDSKQLVTTGDDREARVWNVSPDMVITHGGASHEIDESADGSIWAIASTDGSVYLHDAQSGREMESFASGSHRLVLAVAFAPGGAHLALATLDRELVGWSRGSTLPMWRANAEADVRSLRYSPDGARFATASADGVVRVFDANTGVVLNRLHHSPNGATSVAFSPDGKLMATAGGDAIIRLWRADTFEPAGTLEGHTAPVNEIRFGPKANLLLSASIDGSARVWDVAQRKASAVLVGHGGEVISVDMSRDGLKVVTASADHTVRVWNAGNAEETLRFTDYTQPLRQARFTASGGAILTISFDGVVRRRELGQYSDEALGALQGAPLQAYVCRRYLSQGRDVLDAYEQESVARLSANKTSSVCSASNWAQYAAYAFGAQ